MYYYYKHDNIPVELLNNRLFLEQFMFAEKLCRKYREFLYTPHSHSHTAPPTINSITITPDPQFTLKCHTE